MAFPVQFYSAAKLSVLQQILCLFADSCLSKEQPPGSRQCDLENADVQRNGRENNHTLQTGQTYGRVVNRTSRYRDKTYN